MEICHLINIEIQSYDFFMKFFFFLIFLPFNIVSPFESWTRTTRTPALWGYPPQPHDYPYNFGILQKSLHATHLLKLLNKMWNYEMDPASIVEVTERTWFCPQTDGQTARGTDGQIDRRRETSIPPFNFVEARGIIIHHLTFYSLYWTTPSCLRVIVLLQDSHLW